MPYTDTQLNACIRAVVQDSPFGGEGHRKVWARLRHRGIFADKPRALRLTREAGLLAPHHVGPAHGPRNHEGTITTQAPDLMWGTDATITWTVRDGQVTVLLAYPHSGAVLVVPKRTGIRSLIICLVPNPRTPSFPQ